MSYMSFREWPQTPQCVPIGTPNNTWDFLVTQHKHLIRRSIVISNEMSVIDRKVLYIET